MKELAESKNITTYEEQDIGTAIAEYLMSKNITSTEDDPIFILPNADVKVVNNSIAVSQELREICKKLLNE